MYDIEKYIFVIAVSFLFVACRNSQSVEEIRVINDAFLTVADTFAYDELSLRPPSPDEGRSTGLNVSKQNLFAIIIPDTLFPARRWASRLRYFCGSGTPGKDTSYHQLEKGICSALNDDRKPILFNYEQLDDTGRYVLVNEKESSKLTIPVVGKIEFSEVIFDPTRTLAGFMVEISDGEKSGIEKFFVLSLNNGKWKVINTEIFRVY